MAPHTLRLATRDDCPAIEALIRVSTYGLLAEFHSRACLDAALRDSVFGLDRQLIDDGTYYAVERAGTLVGCGGWSKRRRAFGGSARDDEDNPLLDPATEPARIRAFFVDPGAARQGIGRAIMRASEAAIAAAGFARAHIAATLAGERLYASFGYETYERSDVPLSGGESVDVVHMAKTLAPVRHG